MMGVESLKSAMQNFAETVVSYRFGQVLIKQADRALWTVEKSARWAVPPPLDQDDADNKFPTSDLTRPLPWMFFLWLLLALRVTRESMSLVNLILGKPPVRAADIVSYIQGKRRYLRALKYQGNRNMRARESRGVVVGRIGVLSKLQSILAFTLCFRNAADRNGGAKQISDKQILAIRKKKRMMEKESGYASPAQDENAMEKLIEKMVDMYGESSDDSSDYTLTNATSIKSDSSVSLEESTEDVTLTIPTEIVSSTPVKSNSSPVVSPMDCSNIKECSLLDSTTHDMETVNISISAKNDSINLILSESTEETGAINTKKTTNGQTAKSSTNKSRESKRLDSDVPVLEITPSDDPNNSNGSTAGSYYKRNQSQSKKKDEETYTQSCVKDHNGRSTKHNKVKDSKIKAPHWKKSKKQ